MPRSKILVAEDDSAVLAAITDGLQREGYALTTCRNGEDAWAVLAAGGAELVLLGVVLPRLDGIELCRRIKADPATAPVPVVVVTARAAAAELVVGLGVGADDYLTWPFTAGELAARVRIALQRGALRRFGAPDERAAHGPLVVDLGRHEARLDGCPLPLTPTELRLLHALALQPGRVFRRPQLLARAVGDDAGVDARNIDVHVRALRSKLGAHAALIETVRGIGYRLAAAPTPVRQWPAAGAAAP